MARSLAVLLTILGLAAPAHARIFNFKNEKFATYFRGTAGMSNLKKAAFERSGGQDAGGAELSFSDQTNYNYTGEFGIVFTVSRANVRLGLELLRPNAATGVEARNAGGTALYTVDSTVIGYGGVANMEFNLIQTDSSRLFFTGGGGYFSTTLKNEYRFTAAGQSAYPGQADYVEEGTAFNLMGQASFGYEFLFADSVTAVFDAGYRFLLVNNLKHSRDANTLTGTVAPGQTMQNRGGGDRSIDLSGIWVGLGLRFYIGL